MNITKFKFKFGQRYYNTLSSCEIQADYVWFAPRQQWRSYHHVKVVFSTPLPFHSGIFSAIDHNLRFPLLLRFLRFYFSLLPDSVTHLFPLFSSRFPLPCSSSLPWLRLGRTPVCDELFWKVPGVQRRCRASSLFLHLLSCVSTSSTPLSLSLPQHNPPPPHSHHMSLGDWQRPQRVRAGTDGIWMVHSCMKKVSGWRKQCRGTLNCELSMTKSHCNQHPLCSHTCTGTPS